MEFSECQSLYSHSLWRNGKRKGNNRTEMTEGVAREQLAVSTCPPIFLRPQIMWCRLPPIPWPRKHRSYMSGSVCLSETFSMGQRNGPIKGMTAWPHQVVSEREYSWNSQGYLQHRFLSNVTYIYLQVLKMCLKALSKTENNKISHNVNQQRRTRDQRHTDPFLT